MAKIKHPPKLKACKHCGAEFTAKYTSYSLTYQPYCPECVKKAVWRKAVKLYLKGR